MGNRPSLGKPVPGRERISPAVQLERLAKEGLISKPVLAITELFHNGNTAPT